jgi:hypothetical protein
MTFKYKFGSRTQVWNGLAEKTSGGLKKSDLVKVDGRYKSLIQSRRMKNRSLNPLAMKGMLQQKGSKKFGRIYKNKVTIQSNKNKSNRTKKGLFGFLF